jgi:hypothetical protein
MIIDNVKVNALRESQSPPFHFGDGSRSAGGDTSQVAPVLWADAVTVLRRCDHREGV